MAIVHLPRSLAALLPDIPRRIEIEASTVEELIDRLDAQWPGVRDRLCEPGPVLREHINVFVDREPAGLANEIGADAHVHVIPAVSGG